MRDGRIKAHHGDAGETEQDSGDARPADALLEDDDGEEEEDGAYETFKFKFNARHISRVYRIGFSPFLLTHPPHRYQGVGINPGQLKSTERERNPSRPTTMGHRDRKTGIGYKDHEARGIKGQEHDDDDLEESMLLLPLRGCGYHNRKRVAPPPPLTQCGFSSNNDSVFHMQGPQSYHSVFRCQKSVDID